ERDDEGDIAPGSELEQRLPRAIEPCELVEDAEPMRDDQTRSDAEDREDPRVAQGTVRLQDGFHRTEPTLDAVGERALRRKVFGSPMTSKHGSHDAARDRRVRPYARFLRS